MGADNGSHLIKFKDHPLRWSVLSYSTHKGENMLSVTVPDKWSRRLNLFGQFQAYQQEDRLSLDWKVSSLSSGSHWVQLCREANAFWVWIRLVWFVVWWLNSLRSHLWRWHLTLSLQNQACLSQNVVLGPCPGSCWPPDCDKKGGQTNSPRIKAQCP